MTEAKMLQQMRERWAYAQAEQARVEADVERVCEDVIASYYRWWTVNAWRWGLKLGPLSVFAYRWFDGRLRISVTVLCGREHILASLPPVQK